MNHIWSPWRMEYIKNDKPEDHCVFCWARQHPEAGESLVVHLGERAFVLLNRYPYTSGHLMVVPNTHIPSLELLDAPTRAEMMELAAEAIRILGDEYTPQGYNLGINMGTAAGAGITDHVHLHVVPRWGGDTNFMSTLGETRVLPEALETTRQRIQERWARGTEPAQSEEDQEL